MNIANKIVNEGESFINKMSKEDIISLIERGYDNECHSN